MGYWKWLRTEFVGAFPVSAIIFIVVPIIAFLGGIAITSTISILLGILFVPIVMFIGWSYSGYLMSKGK